MASPDATPYVDLVVQDLDPQDLIDAAINIMNTEVPQWVPREGNMEMVLLEGMATQVAELVYAINRLPSSVIQILLKLNGVDYDPGEQPTADIKFQLTNGDVTIPAGTTVRLELQNDLEPVTFTSATDYTAPEGSLELIVPMVGDRYTDEANGIPAGTDVVLNDSLIFVESVELGTEVVNGRSPETDEEYFERGTQVFSRLTNTLVVPRQFVASMLEEVYVSRALALDNYNAAADTGGDGPYDLDPGYITLAAYGDNVNLTAPQKSALLSKITNLASSDLSIQIIDPTINDIDVEATIYYEDGFEEADVIENVIQALNSYLSPATWPWRRVVRRNDLISLITNTMGVDYVEELTTPATDVTLLGAAPLVRLDSALITAMLDA